MIRLSIITYLLSLLTYKFLKHLFSYKAQNVTIGKLALTVRESIENKDEEAERRITAKEKQRRALQDFFRDTGGKVTDLRVLRSAMYLSDEIDRAVRGLDDENNYIGYRPYNRFFAEGTEELFTNVPIGKSPLVMAAPKADKSVRFEDLDKSKPLPIEYQAMRRSHLKLVGRQLKEYEQEQIQRLQNKSTTSKETIYPNKQQENRWTNRYQQQKGLIQPKNDNYEPPLLSKDLRVGAYQSYKPYEKQVSTKQRLLKFEGEISERRPDLDYKFQDE
ncbi:hypothetical protein ABK040_011674 [Willaertia magna]